MPHASLLDRCPMPEPGSALAPRSRGRVLLVDHDPALRRSYARVLTTAGFEVVMLAAAHDVDGWLEVERFDLVVSDLRRHGPSGLATLHLTAPDRLAD